MWLLLLTAVLVFVKLTLLQQAEEFSWLTAFGLPSAILVILGSTILYQKYLSKLRESHKTVFTNLSCLLFLFTAGLIAFLIFASLYISYPMEF